MIIIDLNAYREKMRKKTPFEEALEAVRKAGQEEQTLKGIEQLDEYFKNHPFEADETNNKNNP